jgi:hypothetical protein
MTCPRLSLPWACASLAIVVVVVFPVVGYWAYARHGTDGIEAAAVAASVCWLSATMALVVTGWPRDPSQAVVGTLVAIPLRLVLPLAVGALLDLRGGSMAAAGVFGLVVVFYLVTLAAETTLILCLKERATRTS